MSRRLRFLSPTFGVLLAASLLSSASATEPWPTFRGPLAAGRALEGLPPGEGPLAFELRWKQPLGSGYSGISVAEGTLVTAFSAGDRDVVAALDPESGDERWRRDLGPVYGGHDGSHDGPVATPAIDRGRIFALGAWGELVALDLEDGEQLWRVHLVEDLGGETPFYGFASSPLVVDDTVVIQIGGEDGSIAGFDAATGELRWRSAGGAVMAQSPILTELAGRRQVVAVGNAHVVGLDPSDGSVLWTLPHESGFAPMGAFTSSPLPLGDNRLLLKLADGETLVVAIVEGEDGLTAEKLEESKGLGKSYSPPATWNEHVYGYTARFLSALDPRSGELLWRSRDPGDGFLVSVGGELAVLTKKGSLHLGAASPEGWTESIRLQLFDDHAWTPPSYAAGALYVRSLGEIARVDLVREAAPTRRADSGELPAVLIDLAAEMETSEDSAAVVDRFMADRQTPWIDGEEVVFLWRGEGEDVAVAGDMIGMRREEPMRRLGESDLWWWRTHLDRRARMSYLFFVDYEPTVDPLNPRRAQSTVLGRDMNWNRGEPLAMSWFAMPDWPGNATESVEVATHGRLERIEVSVERPAVEGAEPPEPAMVPVQVWLPPGYDTSDERYPVVFVHNPFAHQPGDWPQALDQVVGRSAAPVVAALIGRSPSGRVRGAFDAVVAEVDRRYRTRSDREGRANVGMGWEGFQAAIVAFSKADQFGVLGVQSLYALDAQMQALVGAVGDADASTVPLRVYLEWGRWDLDSPVEAMNMRTSSKRVWDLLRERGWAPLGGEVWDSTDWASWSNRTGALIEALFPLDGAPTAYRRWTTESP